MKNITKKMFTLMLFSSGLGLQAGDFNIDWKGHEKNVQSNKVGKYKEFEGFVKDHNLTPQNKGQKALLEAVIENFFELSSGYAYPKCGEYPTLLNKLKTIRTGYRDIAGYDIEARDKGKQYLFDAFTFWNPDYNKPGEDISQDARLVVLSVFVLNPSDNDINTATNSIANGSTKSRKDIERNGNAFTKTFAELYINSGKYNTALVSNNIVTQDELSRLRNSSYKLPKPQQMKSSEPEKKIPVSSSAIPSNDMPAAPKAKDSETVYIIEKLIPKEFPVNVEIEGELKIVDIVKRAQESGLTLFYDQDNCLLFKPAGGSSLGESLTLTFEEGMRNLGYARKGDAYVQNKDENPSSSNKGFPEIIKGNEKLDLNAVANSVGFVAKRNEKGEIVLENPQGFSIKLSEFMKNQGYKEINNNGTISYKKD